MLIRSTSVVSTPNSSVGSAKRSSSRKAASRCTWLKSILSSMMCPTGPTTSLLKLNDELRMRIRLKLWNTVSLDPTRIGRDGRKFARRWQVVNVGGCMDRKHIKIHKPRNSGALYYNYKGFCTIVLSAVININHEVIYVDIGKKLESC